MRPVASINQSHERRETNCSSISSTEVQHIFPVIAVAIVACNNFAIETKHLHLYSSHQSINQSINQSYIKYVWSTCGHITVWGSNLHSLWSTGRHNPHQRIRIPRTHCQCPIHRIRTIHNLIRSPRRCPRIRLCSTLARIRSTFTRHRLWFFRRRLWLTLSCCTRTRIRISAYTLYALWSTYTRSFRGIIRCPRSRTRSGWIIRCSLSYSCTSSGWFIWGTRSCYRRIIRCSA
jgi:hypothetical protein